MMGLITKLKLAIYIHTEFYFLYSDLSRIFYKINTAIKVFL